MNGIYFVISLWVSLLLANKVAILFSYANFETCNFTELMHQFWWFLAPYKAVMTPANRVALIPSFPVLMTFISFSSLIIVANISGTLRNQNGERGHLCFVPHMKGNVFGTSPLSMILIADFPFTAFTILRYVLVNGIGTRLFSNMKQC